MSKEILKQPFLISLLFTPIALLLGYISVGLGHGDYIVATILFPYSILSFIILTPESIETLTLILTSLQFPFYGSIIAIAKLKDRFFLVSISL
tara:strand:+ start:34971 stop:35249 length:279 start_codon:yes stop_codon:yes gene_type:complete